jgi:ABC-type transporter Mla subunit MlaD
MTSGVLCVTEAEFPFLAYTSNMIRYDSALRFSWIRDKETFDRTAAARKDALVQSANLLARTLQKHPAIFGNSSAQAARLVNQLDAFFVGAGAQMNRLTDDKSRRELIQIETQNIIKTENDIARTIHSFFAVQTPNKDIENLIYQQTYLIVSFGLYVMIGDYAQAESELEALLERSLTTSEYMRSAGVAKLPPPPVARPQVSPPAKALPTPPQGRR